MELDLKTAAEWAGVSSKMLRREINEGRLVATTRPAYSCETAFGPAGYDMHNQKYMIELCNLVAWMEEHPPRRVAPPTRFTSEQIAAATEAAKSYGGLGRWAKQHGIAYHVIRGALRRRGIRPRRLQRQEKR